MTGSHPVEYLTLVQPGDHVLPLEAPAEEQIEYKAYDRQEDQRDHPGYRPDRIPVLLEHDRDAAYHSNGVCCDNHVIEPRGNLNVLRHKAVAFSRISMAKIQKIYVIPPKNKFNLS